MTILTNQITLKNNFPNFPRKSIFVNKTGTTIFPTRIFIERQSTAFSPLFIFSILKSTFTGKFFHFWSPRFLDFFRNLWSSACRRIIFLSTRHNFAHMVSVLLGAFIDRSYARVKKCFMTRRTPFYFWGNFLSTINAFSFFGSSCQGRTILTSNSQSITRQFFTTINTIMWWLRYFFKMAIPTFLRPWSNRFFTINAICFFHKHKIPYWCRFVKGKIKIDLSEQYLKFSLQELAQGALW